MRFLWILTFLAVMTPAFQATSQTIADPKDINSLKSLYERPATIPFPKDSPYTAKRAALGKLLFFDSRLSVHRNISCATCHNPSFGWETPTALSVGAANKPLGRHSPTLLNLAWAETFFWDGRASSLEEQSGGPIETADEMNMPFEDLIKRLNSIKGYPPLFENAFPGEGISKSTIQKAVATFERTLVSGPAPFDRWVEGEEHALSAAAKRGFGLFVGKAQCSLCHMGWNFTDQQFHDIGLPDETDQGRKKITGQAADVFAFKTPGLRNIMQRAPYMHNGSLETLTEVIDHYRNGGMQRDSLSPLMKPFDLSRQELSDMMAFFESLTGEDPPVTLPVLPQ